jgi:flagellar basal body-associated protein FliL
MRLILILFVVLVIAGVGLTVTQKQKMAEAPSGSQWFNIFGEGNQIMASVNLADKNSVKYFSEPKAAFDALFIGHMTYRQSCEKALAEKEKAKK